MFETVFNLVVDFLYQQYERFGKWFFVMAGTLFVLLAVLLLYCFGFLGSRSATRQMQEVAKDIATGNSVEDGVFQKAAEESGQAKANALAAQAKWALNRGPMRSPDRPQRRSRLGARSPSRPAENLADWKKEDYLAASRG